MGVSAAVGIALVGTVASVENSNQQRRLAGQARDRQQHDVDVANRRYQEEKTQEEDQAFSRIARQRQRAVAYGSRNWTVSHPEAAEGMGSRVVSVGGGAKTTLGS